MITAASGDTPSGRSRFGGVFVGCWAARASESGTRERLPLASKPMLVLLLVLNRPIASTSGPRGRGRQRVTGGSRRGPRPGLPVRAAALVSGRSTSVRSARAGGRGRAAEPSARVTVRATAAGAAKLRPRRRSSTASQWSRGPGSNAGPRSAPHQPRTIAASLLASGQQLGASRARRQPRRRARGRVLQPCGRLRGRKPERCRTQGCRVRASNREGSDYRPRARCERASRRA